MASNSLKTNPVLISSALSSYKQNAGLGSFQTVILKKIEWLSPANPGDTANIVDPTTGNIIQPFTCETAGQSQLIDWSPRPLRVSDFAVPVISSGELVITLV
jgi:hypothetical protein